MGRLNHVQGLVECLVCAKWWRSILTRTVRLVSSFYFLFLFFIADGGDGAPAMGLDTKRDCRSYSRFDTHTHERKKRNKFKKKGGVWPISKFFKASTTASEFLFFPFFCVASFYTTRTSFRCCQPRRSEFSLFSSSFFVVGGRRRRKKKIMMCVSVCVPHFFRVLWRASFFFFPPLSPSSTRYSFPRSAPDNDDSFILFSFLFVMCTNRS